MWDFEINTIGGSTKSLVRVEGLIGGGHQECLVALALTT